MSAYKPTVAIVILAAGASTRMGTPKQLLPYRGRSLLGHITIEAIASVCEPIVVVLGASAQQIQHEVNQFPVQVVENSHWTKGMSASIQTGIQWLNALTDNIEAVVLTVCDQPFVSAQIINQLVEAYYYTGKPIIASEYSGTSGVPALFSHRFFLELTDLKETEGAKQIIKKYSHEVFSIPFPEGAIDIDTPNEYEKLKAKG
jgi:molybdenum cofactor cytidylyltransferase